MKNIQALPIKLPKRSARIVWGSFLLALLILIGVCFALLQQLKIGVADLTSRILINQAVLRVNYVASEMRMLNDKLKQIERLYAAQGRQLDLQTMWDQGLIDPNVFAGIQITDAQGDVVLSSAAVTPGLNLSHTSAFKTHAARDSTNLLIDNSAFESGGAQAYEGVSRRLNGPKGNFSGVILATINSQYFKNVYDELKVASQVTASLVGLDGEILMSLDGRDNSIFKDFKGQPFINQINKGILTGQYRSNLEGDGIGRHVHYQKIPGFDLVVVSTVTANAWDNLTPTGKTVFLTCLVAVIAAILAIVLIFRSHIIRENRALALNQQLTTRLQTSEERLRLAVVGSNLGTWDWHLDQNRFTTNDLFKARFKSWPDASVGKISLLKELIHPEELASLVSKVERHMDGTTPYFSSECRICSPAGDWVWARVQGQVTERSLDQRPIRLSGTVMDITEQKTAEARIRDYTEQLAIIFALNQDALVVFNHHRRVNFINPAFHHLTHLEPALLLGLSEEEFTQQLNAACVPDKKFCGLPMLRARTEKPSASTRELLVTREPNSRVLLATLTTSSANSISQVLSLRDVTHETLVEKLKSEYLSTAAHEIRSPMASILGFAELMTDTELNANHRGEFSNIILSQAHRIKGILDELLDLARIEAGGGQDFVFESVDLQVLVEQVVTEFLPPDGRPLPTIDIPSQHCRIDYDKASQALLNVITNAYKYSDKNSPVSIRYVKPVVVNNLEMAGITVQDQGIGMNQENLKKVFERFYRVNENVSAAGTGLGMAIVKEIMTKHEGEVLIKSIPGHGTAVTLLFPLFKS